MTLIARTVDDDVIRLLSARFGDELGKVLAATVGIGRDRAFKLAVAESGSDELLSALLRPKVCVALRNAGVFWRVIEAINATAPVWVDAGAWYVHRQLLFEKETK
jgi:hypothetical protein